MDNLEFEYEMLKHKQKLLDALYDEKAKRKPNGVEPLCEFYTQDGICKGLQIAIDILKTTDWNGENNG